MRSDIVLSRGRGFLSWTGEAVVTSGTPASLTDSTGSALSPTKTYKVAACSTESGAQRGAVALFVGNGTTFSLRTVYEEGTTGSHIRLYLNSDVPYISVYGGSGPYHLMYMIEELTNFGTALSEFAILQRLMDAPSDGKNYGRKNAGWEEIVTGGGISVDTQDSNYTFVAADAGRCKTRSTNNSSVTYTIPTNTFSAGDVLYVSYMGSRNTSYYTKVTRASGISLYRAGTKTAVTDAYVYGGGVMTIFFVSSTEAVYSGPGIT